MLRPGRRGFALHRPVGEVVVADLQLVADLPEAAARPSRCHRLFPRALGVGVCAERMCHVHTVRAECLLPLSNGDRFSSSRDFGPYRIRTVTLCGVVRTWKLAGKAAPTARRLET
ncbi:hypothetical protein GCM10010398_36780 [Streptomyces fimbriatus]